MANTAFIVGVLLSRCESGVASIDDLLADNPGMPLRVNRRLKAIRDRLASADADANRMADEYDARRKEVGNV